MKKLKFVAICLVAFTLFFQSCAKEDSISNNDNNNSSSCDVANIGDDIIGTWTSDSWSGSVNFESPSTSGTRVFKDPQDHMGAISGAAVSYDEKFYTVTSSAIIIEHRKCWNCTSDAEQWKYSIIEYDCNKMVIESQRPGLPNTRYTLTK